MTCAQTSLFPVNTIEMLRDGTVYMRTTSLFHAVVPVVFPDGTRIRHLSQAECNSLCELIRNRDTFSRHRGDRDFYYQRAAAFADRTIIEVMHLGSPGAVKGAVADASDVAEQVTLIAASMVQRKPQVLRCLGIGARPATQVELLRGPRLEALSSKTTPTPPGGGLRTDSGLVKRIRATGLTSVYKACGQSSETRDRIRLSLGWLFESRCEPRFEVAVVKTAIALESLLVLSESESLSRVLSERTAFLLSDLPAERERVSVLIKSFYDARSGIVHGGKKKKKALKLHSLDAVDRLIALVLSVISAGISIWPSTEALRRWCEAERWGPPQKIARPFSKKYLRNALDLFDT